MSDRLPGTVKSFSAGLGTGLIKQTNGGPDVFVHYSVIEVLLRFDEAPEHLLLTRGCDRLRAFKTWKKDRV